MAGRAAPRLHNVNGECSSELLFYPLLEFPIACGNNRDLDPLTFDELRPHLNPKGMVFEFTPSGESICWDANSLLLMMESRRLSEGVDFFRHPIHNCKVDPASAELVFLVAERSGKKQKQALRLMLKHVLISGAAAVTLFMGTTFIVCARSHIIAALEHLTGGNSGNYSAGFFTGMASGVTALASTVYFGLPIADSSITLKDVKRAEAWASHRIQEILQGGIGLAKREAFERLRPRLS